MLKRFGNLFQSISQIGADVAVLDMHSLTDMVDHIQLITKTLQVFDGEIAQLKQDIKPLEQDDPELKANVYLLEDKLSQLTNRSEEALKMVEVRYNINLFVFILMNLH